MLDIGIFWKSQKLILSRKNQSVVVAKISSRKTIRATRYLIPVFPSFVMQNNAMPTLNRIVFAPAKPYRRASSHR